MESGLKMPDHGSLSRGRLERSWQRLNASNTRSWNVIHSSGAFTMGYTSNMPFSSEIDKATESTMDKETESQYVGACIHAYAQTLVMVSLIVYVMTACNALTLVICSSLGVRCFLLFLLCVFLFPLNHGFYRLHQECQSLLGCPAGRLHVAVGGFVGVRPGNLSKV